MTTFLRWRRVVRAMVRRLRQIPPRELLTTMRAAVTLIAVELTIRGMSVRQAAQFWGVPLHLGPAGRDLVQVPLEELPERAVRSLRAAHRATLVWPFADGPCLRRSILGGHLIRDLDPGLRLGFTTSNEAVAHAWLEIAGRPLEDVTGFVAFQSRRAEGAA